MEKLTDNTEVGATARVIVGRRFANVIPSGPDKLASHVRVAVLLLENLVRRSSPTRSVQLIRTHVVVDGVSTLTGTSTDNRALAWCHREKVHATGADCRCGFRAPDHLVRELAVEGSEGTGVCVALALALVIEANDVNLCGQPGIGPSVIHSNCYLLSGIFLVHDILQPLGGSCACGV